MGRQWLFSTHCFPLSIATLHPASLMLAFLTTQIPPLQAELCDLPLISICKLFSLLLFPNPQSYIFYSYWFPNPHVPIAALPQTSAASPAIPCSLCQQSWYLKMLWMLQCGCLDNPSIFKYPEELSVAVMSGTAAWSESRLGQTTHCPWSCPWVKDHHLTSHLLTWVSPNPFQRSKTKQFSWHLLFKLLKLLRLTLAKTNLGGIAWAACR